MTVDDAGHAATLDGDRPRRSRWWVLPVLVAALVVGVLAGFLGIGLRDADAAPSEASAAAGFARDMQTHHGQAVQMAMIVRDRTDDPAIRFLAYDIALTQQHQIGQMYAWLVQWGLPQTSSRPAMAWMAVPGAGHGTAGHEERGSAETPAGARMAGMATPADLRRLGEATGRGAEVLFLELMIAHHQGGIGMAEAVLERPAPEYVHRLAGTMVTGQQAEITAMRALLGSRRAG